MVGQLQTINQEGCRKNGCGLYLSAITVFTCRDSSRISPKCGSDTMPLCQPA